MGFAKEVSFSETASRVKAARIIFDKASEMYFCGYKLSDVFERDLFRQISNYAEVGFCYELAGVAMFLLKDFPLSRIVHGTAIMGDEIGHHAIAEFEYYHEEFVLDLMWSGLQPIPATTYKAAVGFHDVDFKAAYQTFWEDRTARLIYEYMRTKELSHLFCELAYFRPSDNDKTLIMAEGKVSGMTDLTKHMSQIGVGYRLISRPTLSGKIIDQALIDDLMNC